MTGLRAMICLAIPATSSAQRVRGTSGHEVEIDLLAGQCILRTIRGLVATYLGNACDAQLTTNFNEDEEPYQRLLLASCRVMQILRAKKDMSINRLQQQLVQESVLMPHEEDRDKRKQHQLIFGILGWISLLYLPAPHVRIESFKINGIAMIPPKKTSVNSEKAQRPIDELLRAFGPILPTSPDHFDPSPSSAPHSRLKFHVASLSAATLISLTKVKLVWVEAISAHLEFDTTIPELYIFKLPSFCNLQQSDDSIISV
ncbi:hypothetical protein FH972_024408 [Carpinus fangiana]|uniref:Uncharacterized protein n=1 Tax=Carpinus fangiana TaxID=176857 RepID=A0A5N6KY93_9ROSI|nr:hypothetical protein FH972_024408 [Carpinus fangiana]